MPRNRDFSADRICYVITVCLQRNEDRDRICYVITVLLKKRTAPNVYNVSFDVRVFLLVIKRSNPGWHTPSSFFLPFFFLSPFLPSLFPL